MAVPSRWISHDLPMTKRSPCAERASGAIAADQADADVRRCLRQQFRGSVAEATLVKDEEVEASEMRRDPAELLAQRSLRQAQSCGDGESLGLDGEQHERAVVASSGDIQTGDELLV
jgi:hypothetical protein